MSLVSKYHIVPYNFLKFAGFAVIVGAAWFAPHNAYRIATFIGAVMLAAGYAWNKVVG